MAGWLGADRLCGVGERCKEPFTREVGVAFEQLLDRLSGRQRFENQLDGDARAFDDGLAQHHARRAFDKVCHETSVSDAGAGLTTMGSVSFGGRAWVWCVGLAAIPHPAPTAEGEGSCG